MFAQVKDAYLLIKAVAIMSVFLCFGCHAEEENKELPNAVETEVESETSFDEVTRQLDSGGDLYLYISAEEAGEKLIDNLQKWREASISTMKERGGKYDAVTAEKVFDLGKDVIRESGLMELSGVGASSIKLDEDTYRRQFILYHYPDIEPGQLWQAIREEESSPVEVGKLLPSNTALAFGGKFDLPLLWNWVNNLIENSDLEPISEQWADLKRDTRKRGFDLETIVESLSDQVVVAVTLDRETTQTVPLGMGQDTIELPDISGMLAVKVEDHQLYQRLKPLLEMNEQSRTEEFPLGEMIYFPMPGSVPLEIQPCMAKLDDYFVIASRKDIVTRVAEAFQGPDKRLAATTEFKRLSEGLPEDGTSLVYWSPRLSETLYGALDSIGHTGQTRTRPTDFIDEEMKNAFVCSIWQGGETGLKITTNSTLGGGEALVTQTMLAPTAIGGAMLMPALARARGEAKKVACASNLKQLGIVLVMYYNDHGRHPSGETTGEIFRELVDEGYVHGRGMFNCPGKSSGEIDFDRPDGVGYYIDPGIPKNFDPMRAVMADRPPWALNHGDGVNVLFADSHVEFIKPGDSGPSDRISNPYIEEDTDIYSNTGDPRKHAWIRWER